VYVFLRCPAAVEIKFVENKQLLFAHTSIIYDRKAIRVIAQRPKEVTETLQTRARPSCVAMNSVHLSNGLKISCSTMPQARYARKGEKKHLLLVRFPHSYFPSKFLLRYLQQFIF
jgi:hypothetical protein